MSGIIILESKACFGTTGLERIFQQIATTIDGNLPTGQEWHRKLLEQMQTDFSDLRPPVLSAEAVQALDEFLRFRHVVRNIYAFQFDPGRGHDWYN